MKTNPNDLIVKVEHVLPGGTKAATGLTKREYFAALAMQGILAATPEFFNQSEAAIYGVRQADALIKALNEESK